MPVYYDPNLTDQEYYSPENNSQNSGDIGSALRTAGTMIGLNIIGVTASRYLMSAAKSTLKNWQSSSQSIIRRSLAQKTFNLNSSIKKYTTPYKQTIQDSSIYKAGLERQKYLNSIKDSSDYSIKRVTSAFKDPKTLLATTTGVWRRNVLSGLAVSYGVDSLLGVTRDMGLDRKAFYDVPGQVGNFAKWLGYSSVGGLALGAAGPALKVAGSLGIKSLQKTFGGEFGRKVLNTAAGFTKTNLDQTYQNMLSKEELSYSASVVKKGLKFGGKINEVKKTLNEGLYTFSDTIRNRLQYKLKTQKVFGSLNSAIRDSVNILKTSTNNSTSGIQFSGLSVANEVANYARQSKDWKDPKVSLSGSQLDDFFAETHRRHNKESILQKVFGKVLKPVRLKDVVSNDWVEETFGNLSEKYTRDTSRQFINKVLDLKVGKNVYKDWRKPNIRGGMIDLNFLDPVTIMRNSLSPILNYQIYNPLAKNSIALAEMLGVNKWISEAPDMFATRNKPEFRFVDKSNPNITSVADLAREKNSLYVYTKGGKWAVLSGDTVQVVNTNRNLYRATKSGHDKNSELTSITIDRLKRDVQSKSAAEYNRIVDRIENKDRIGNKYFDFFGITTPKGLKTILSNFQHKVRTGKGYKDEFTKFFHGTLQDAAGVVPLVENVYGHTTQVLSKIGKSREAIQVMANHIHDTKLKQDFLSATVDDQSLVNKIAQLPLDAEFFNNKNVVRALEDIKAFPKEARNHPVEHRLGIFSEMTSYDITRTNLIDNIFIQDMSKGQPHPLLRIAPELENAGVINANEKEALLIHAKLAAFKNDGLIKGVTDDLPVFKDVLERVRSRSKSDGYGLLNDLIKFTQRNEMRRPSILTSQEKILDTFNQASDIHPFYSSSNNAIRAFGEFAQKSIDRTMNLIEEISPFKKYYLSNHGFTGNMKYLGRTVMGVSAAFGAYRILDTVTAANPLLDETMLDDGITGVLADSAAKARFGLSRVADVTGTTKGFKYLHGLMPLSETAVPGAGIGTIFGLLTKTNPIGIAKYAAIGALANRVASPILPDMTKSYEELREIYAGREQVPVYKSPMWLLGGTPWEGTKVIGYSPNWYVRAKSRWKETSTMYGSAFRKLIHEPLPLLGFNVGDLVNPYYNERLHYNSRPFGVTGGVFDEVPLIGKTLSATIGRVIKPPKTMHQEYLTREFTSANEDGNPYPFAIRPPTIPEGLFHMNKGEFTNKVSGQKTLINNKYWSETASEDFLYDMQNFMGLKGFIAGSIAERIFDTNRVVPTLETAGRIASFSRSYTDMNLGGAGVITEPLRRIIDKPEYRQYGLNPIPNLMPQYLGTQFLTGDPYSKLVKGEIRLPGNAYKSTHTDLRETMPARSSMLGKTLEQQVQYFTGLTPPLELEQYEILQGGTKYHRAIQDSLSAEGLLIQAEAFVHDVKNDITGHVDAIIRDGSGGKGRKALEIKTIQDSSFNELNAPKEEHISQLSFYLKMLKMRSGTLLYINRENPSQVKTFEIYYDKNRWERDLEKLKKARYIASTMLDDSRVDSLGYSYSWADRLKILSDVNPNSTEFKEAKQIVSDQIKMGVADEEDIRKYKQALKIKQNRIRSYELFPNRFKNKVFHPEGQVNIQSTNEDIKAAKEYTLPERCLHPDTLIKVNNKMIPIKELYIDEYSNLNTLSHLNNNKKITAVTNRNSDKNEIIKTIKFSGLPEVILSNEHPLYVIESKKCKNFCNNKTVCVPKHRKICSKCNNNFYYNYNPKFKEVKDINNNDFILFPIKQIENTEKYININNLFPTWIEENNEIIFKKLNGKHLKLPKYILKSEELFELFGWFLAEGSYNKATSPFNGINFVLHQKEENVAFRLCFLINKIFNINSFEIKNIKKSKAIMVRCYSSSLALLFKELFGSGAKNKYIHDYVLHSDMAFLKSLVFSVLAGDGFIDKKGFSIIKTISPNLCYTYFDILRNMNILPTIRKEKGNKFVNILGNTCLTNDVYKITWKENSKNYNCYIYNNYSYHRIQKIEISTYTGSLYNLHIFEDESYTTHAGLVHNCIGSLYERFTNTNTFLINKFLAAKDPIEHYKMTRLYGKEYKPWDEPIRGWVDPYMRGLASKTDPLSGSLSFGMGGFVFGGGPIGAIAGGLLGAGYGGIHGLYRTLSNSTYIPESINEKREIMSYFDAAKYERNSMLAQLSTGITQQDFLTQRDATLTAFNIGGKGATVANLFRGTSAFEKPYIEAFLKAKDPDERQEILNIVPKDLASALRKQWSRDDSKDNTQSYINNSSNELAKGLPKFKFDSSVLDQNINLDDIKLKTIQEQGFDQFEFGLGWNEQMLRIQESNRDIKAINIQRLNPENNSEYPNISPANLRGSINNLLYKSGIRGNTQIYIDNSIDKNYVQIIIRQNRSKSVINALKRREKYKV